MSGQIQPERTPLRRVVKPLLVNNNNNSHLLVCFISLLNKVKTDNCTENGSLYTDKISCLKSQTENVLSIKDVLYQERLLSTVKNVFCLMLYRRFSMNHAKDFRISNCQLLQAVLMVIVCLYDHTMIIFCSFSLHIEKISHLHLFNFLCENIDFLH